MGNGVRPGPASIEGLCWLARVGPAPFDAWRCAMGWVPGVGRSHVRRLEREGWLERHPMTRGDGKLLVATRRGVGRCGLAVSAPAVPECDRWPHYCACAWTVAWLTVRGRDWRGPREVLLDPELKREVRWMTRNGPRHFGRRPDLAVVIPSGVVAIEVGRRGSSDKQLRAVLSMYERWVAGHGIDGVIYICASEIAAERVRKLADGEGLDRIRIELLSKIRDQAEDAKVAWQLQLPGVRWPRAATT